MRKPHRLYCFSPPVMLVTFILEISLAVYTLWRYKLTSVSRLVVAILVFLATFQAAEFMVCTGGMQLSGEVWSRIGFVAITLLPPLGLHLATVLANRPATRLKLAAYISGAAFMLFFALAPRALEPGVCAGNYVIFDLLPGTTFLYTLYYYGWLVVAVTLCWQWAAQTKRAKERRALKALAIGYLAFLVPTTLANIVDSATIAGIPSIMCGFAVLLALTLVGWVLPAAKLK